MILLLPIITKKIRTKLLSANVQSKASPEE